MVPAVVPSLLEWHLGADEEVRTDRWGHMRRTTRAFGGLLIAVTTATTGLATPAGAQAPSAAPPVSAPAAPALSAKALPADVEAALANGPVKLFVNYDSPQMARAMTGASSGSASSRTEALSMAAAVGSSVKRAALQRAGSGLRVAREYAVLPTQLVTVADLAAARRLLAQPEVASIGLPKLRARVAGTTSSAPGTMKAASAGAPALVPMGTAYASPLDQIRQPQTVAAGYTGEGYRVAVLDTGLDWNSTQGTVNSAGAFGTCTGAINPANANCRVKLLTDTTVDTQPTSYVDLDPEKHGTNVAGILAQTAPKAGVDVYKVFSLVDHDSNPATPSKVLAWDGDVVEALNDLVLNGTPRKVRSANLSIGGSPLYNLTNCTKTADPSLAPYQDAIAALRTVGIVPVIAAGNYAITGTNPTKYTMGVATPACLPGAVAVGASGTYGSDATKYWSDDVAAFSQGGPLVSLLAPGVMITAAGKTFVGTSQAAPHVAAAVALMAQANPAAATPDRIQAILKSTGPVITDTRDANRQVRRLDLLAAVSAIKGITAPPIITLVPRMPTMIDGCGTAYDSVFIPNQPGVQYVVKTSSGYLGVPAPGRYRISGSATFTARAAAGYALSGVTAWSRSWNAAGCVPALAFTDVKPTTQFYTEIMWLANVGVTAGWLEPNGTRTFRPLWSTKYDAMAAFMYRVAGKQPYTAPATSPFVDITTRTQFYREMMWNAVKRVMPGFSIGSPARPYFLPLRTVSRADMAAFMYRLAGSPAYTAPRVSPFVDVTPATPYYREICWMSSAGISTGWVVGSSRYYRPTQAVARDAMAAFMYRLSARYALG